MSRTYTNCAGIGMRGPRGISNNGCASDFRDSAVPVRECTHEQETKIGHIQMLNHDAEGTRLCHLCLPQTCLGSTTRLFTRLLGFSPDHWALHQTTGFFIRILGFSLHSKDFSDRRKRQRNHRNHENGPPKLEISCSQSRKLITP